MANKINVTTAEQAYAKMILAYLHEHYSRKIKATDIFLIYAMVAWLHAADKEWPGRLRRNNPFGVTDPQGKLVKFASVQAGIIGAAKLLISYSKSNATPARVVIVGGKKKVISGHMNTHKEMELYKGLLNALKNGGNTGANQFLVWLAYTSWSPQHYGWNPADGWNAAASEEHNKLLSWYLRLQIVVKTTTTKKKQTVIPAPPRDLNAPIVVRNYIDPWAVLGFYRERHPAIPVLPGADDLMQAE